MNTHPKQERTFVILKPDSIQRSLVGEIIERYERVGLKIVALKMCIPSAEHVEKHYTLDPEWRRITGEKSIKAAQERGTPLATNDPFEVTAVILERLKRYMTSGPVVCIVLEGAHAVAIVRKITGGTEPLSTDVGTIRGDYVLDSYSMSDKDDRSIRNLVHASSSVAEAEKEIALWFTPEDIMSYHHVQEAVLYDVNLDGKDE